MTANKTYNVLFLWHGQLGAEHPRRVALESLGPRQVPAPSVREASPKGQVHPLALDLLKRMNLPAEGFRSKSWEMSFVAPGAPPIDFIFTVCDTNAAGEGLFPFWPGGKPMMMAALGYYRGPPPRFEGTDADKAFAFRKALKELETRISKLFTSLPIDPLSMAHDAAKRKLGGPSGKKQSRFLSPSNRVAPGRLSPKA